MSERRACARRGILRLLLVLFLLASGAPSLAGAAGPSTGSKNQEAGLGPIDRFSRASRSFNFWLLDHALEPLARGYNFVMPKWGQARIHDLLDNLRRPRDFLNSLLQGKPRRAGRHLVAFLVDSTVGIAGAFRPSDRLLEPESPETFGETLGVWGLPAGSYLVLPLYGESCLRCLIGSLGDAVLYPLWWIPAPAGTIAGAGAWGLGGVNLLARQMPGHGAGEAEWKAYRERLHERPPYPEAKRLFLENLEFDVQD